MDLSTRNLSVSTVRCGIVLSAGNGTRLRDFVFQRCGDNLPKQYINFIGTRSMLEHTCDRAERLIPAERLGVIVAREHLRFPEVRRQLDARDSGTIVIQPINKETAPGILLPVLHVHKRHREAVIAIFPSDHFVLEEDTFMRHVDYAFRLVESDASRIVLLGLEPHGPDSEYGYIVPGEEIGTFPLNSARQVEMFVEKPCLPAAKKIIASGALWNTMVMVFACKTFLSIIQHSAPDLYHAFCPILEAIGTPGEHDMVNEVYQRLRPINFSKGVLEVLPLEHRRGLLVLPVRGLTWSDWGTPEHLSNTLRHLGAADYVPPERVSYL